ncbi:SusD family protein [Sphingobacterium spiritivorum ATCC 33300]|uniref:SusD family protein n=1 Tax=Sphingobacterium spiritivorum ATCC 33300 TaxID=525372 RepID=C2G0D7_SPHSI|nr:RagB/SusD family nutrient uptake outer membrane protein [Sphingobacterium spiritivorum]EEI91317.1 SusD family protein [Sphingobacterium spiritivorum ATCC 33300]QQS97420.1 RagB/SusD family nutrient uptake outer membrane protein [Sphingobacterium spiritivorum]
MKLYSYILVVAGLIAVTSCEKNYLDRSPEDKLTPENYFRSENDLALYCNSFYNSLPDAEGVYNEDIDNIVKNTLPDQVTGKRQVPVSGGGWNWDNLRNINFFLENYNRTLAPEIANKYGAVARFFRAYFYFDKVKRFGDVPWYSKAIDQNDMEALLKKRDSRTLVMDSIIADLDFAIANLSTTKSSEKVTKWTALALKSRVALFEGTFRKYHTDLNLPDSKRFLELAAAASRQVMDGNVYSIYQGTDNMGYQQLFSSVNAIDGEIILARKYSDGLQIWHNVNYYTITASYGKPGLNKDLVNTYLMRDGSRFTDKPGYATMSFYQETQNRDPRLSQTIRTPGYKRIGGTAVQTPNFGNSVTGYQLIKFVGDVRYDSYNRSENDMPLFRYAEVLLNYAEAKAELDDLSQADIDRSVKLLRDRVSMPNMLLSNATANPDAYLMAQYPNVKGSQTGAVLEIRRERRIELVMESFRWDDIMRWKAGPVLTRQFKGMYFPSTGQFDLDGDGKMDVWIYEGNKPTASGIQLLKLGSEIILENGTSGNVIVNAHIAKVFDEKKDYLWPIPTQELQLNENLVQNPFWE